MNPTFRRAALFMAIPFGAIAVIGLILLALAATFVEVEGASEAENRTYLLTFALLIFAFAFLAAAIGGQVVLWPLMREMRVLGAVPGSKKLWRAVSRGRADELDADDMASAMRSARLMTIYLPMTLATMLSMEMGIWVMAASNYMVWGLPEMGLLGDVRPLIVGFLIVIPVVMLGSAIAIASSTRRARAFLRANSLAV